MSRRGGEKKRRTNDSTRDGQRRRSPRFLDSQSCNAAARAGASTGARGKTTSSKQHLSSSDDDLDLVSRTKHKLPAGQRPPQQADQAANQGESSTDKDEVLPEKQILELVLDILQRRDTQEIFAEPVDPSEVEEYYELIEEPMDFGTMRAKLHEDMYKTLQQFERDVFLIFGNAMHFNPSSTVYFRQARALEELARKVFHVLRTDPKNLESEFATIRRRSRRGLQDGQSEPNFNSCQMLERDMISQGASTSIGKRGHNRESSLLSVVDRRCTYKPMVSVFDKTDSIVSPIHNDMKQLINTDRQTFGYKESLLLFVKDLGPTAQRVARSKLQGLWMRASNHPRTDTFHHTAHKDSRNLAALSSQKESSNDLHISGDANWRHAAASQSGGPGSYTPVTATIKETAKTSLVKPLQNDCKRNFDMGTQPLPVNNMNQVQHEHIDLNQGQDISIAGPTINGFLEYASKAQVTLASRSIGTRNFGSHFTADYATGESSRSMSSSVPRQFTFNVPYLESRVKEVSDIEQTSSKGIEIFGTSLHPTIENNWRFSFPKQNRL